MKRFPTSFRSVLAVAVLLSAVQAFGYDARGSFTKTVKVSGAVDVDVTTGSGNVKISIGSVDSVTVHARIHANDGWFSGRLSAEERVKGIEQDPPVKQNGSSVTIGHIEDEELRRNVSIDYDISVPENTRVHSQTGSGDQEIAGVHGPVRVGTGSGTITVRDVSDELRASTGSGDIHLDHIKGHVYANTGSGEVEARYIGGGLNAETGSGNIIYDQDSPGEVNVHTGSGSIELHNVKGGVEARSGSGDIKVDGEARNNWTIHASSGSVDLRLPSGAAFEVDAHSGSGDVTVDHPITVQGTIKHNRVQGKVGNGGVLLSLQTGSGDIHIR
jgi:DUF4097 and DUF4098 domain-containing protein YvlB